MPFQLSALVQRITSLTIGRTVASVLLFAPVGAWFRPADAQSKATSQLAPPAASRPVNETFRILVDSLNLRVLVRHHRATSRGIGDGRSPVLFVHGSSFPSALAAAFPFDGVSWMDDLAAKGFDVWALDFIGYGGSDRYPEMRDAPFAHTAVGRASEAERQILAAARLIVGRTRSSRVSIVAHSWGTIPAGLVAGDSPELIDRLVDFGPVAQRAGKPDTTTQPAFAFVSEGDQNARFNGYVPSGETPVLDPKHFAVWGPAYLATDSSSHSRSPASVEVPNGPSLDVAAAWSGHLPYDPARIVAPVMIIRGEWDVVTRDADARWLWDALSHAPLKRDVKLSRATHVMHLESARRQLYDEVAVFLAGRDSVAARPSAGVRSARPSTETPVERVIPIAGMGALTGPVQSFGINSRAAIRAAVDSINRGGGIRLRDGAHARFEFTYDDDHCQPADAIALLRRIVASSALAVVGPSCSSVAEPLFRELSSSAADTGGLRIPIFTDGATKADLASISQWAFRNTPNERDMYHALWNYVRRVTPGLHTVFGGEEADFAHSHTTWSAIIRPEAEGAGFTVLGAAHWSISDTTFTEAVRRMRDAASDVVVLSAHSRTTCGLLREMVRQNVHPALVVGLTSAVSAETVSSCGDVAESLIAPTTFLATTASARAAEVAVQSAGGSADLHSMAAWEIVFALRSVIERADVHALLSTVAADRRAIRDGLAKLSGMPGLLGQIERTRDRESRKPFLLVRVIHGHWEAVSDTSDHT